MNTKVLKISQVKIDDKFYPRMKYDWFTVNDYKNSMIAGAKFPPIEVALYNKSYYLIDGRHRLECFKQLKDEHCTCVVHTNLNAKQIFIMAVKANVTHGRPLSTQDKVMVIDKLEKFKINPTEVSSIINIPLDKLEKFKMDKITNTISGETTYLKSTCKHYAGVEVADNFNEQQDKFSTRGQLHLLNQVIDLIENGIIDLNEPLINKAFMKIKSLTQGIKVPLLIKR